jgi:ribosomal protein L30/L7E
MNSYGDGNTYRGTVCKDEEWLDALRISRPFTTINAPLNSTVMGMIRHFARKIALTKTRGRIHQCMMTWGK